MTSKTRGRIVIINNEIFQDERMATRKGTNIDWLNLQTLFKALHFDVRSHRNQKAAEIKKILADESKEDYHKTADCFVLVILSHGKEGAIYGTDGGTVSYKQLYEPFDNCKDLKGKPKLFIIQACQNADKKDGSSEVNDDNLSDETDSPSMESLAKTDIFVAMSTFPESSAMRNENFGSWFIRAICEVFQDYACDHDLYELMMKVRDLVSKRRVGMGEGQVPLDFHTLRKKLYFFPGYGQ